VDRAALHEVHRAGRGVELGARRRVRRATHKVVYRTVPGHRRCTLACETHARQEFDMMVGIGEDVSVYRFRRP